MKLKTYLNDISFDTKKVYMEDGIAKIDKANPYKFIEIDDIKFVDTQEDSSDLSCIHDDLPLYQKEIDWIEENCQEWIFAQLVMMRERFKESKQRKEIPLFEGTQEALDDLCNN
tara:strand:+ start:826 stop:1167 length:342 start_codon:yes stop_codon:yes gene_type:complete